MLERGTIVHSLNPKQLDRFRDRFTVQGRRTIADSLRTDRSSHRGAHPTLRRRTRADDPFARNRSRSKLAERLRRCG
jgi:hypothetical protein